MAIDEKIELAEGKSPPILTGILIFLLLVISFNYRPGHTEIWLHDHVFQVTAIIDSFSQGQYADVLQRLFYSNFLATHIIQTLFSAYFIFTFGAPVESRLGPIRYSFLVLASATIPWLVQYFDIVNFPVWPIYFEHPKAETYFFGPVYIICALLGAYSVVAIRKHKRELFVLAADKTRGAEIFNRTRAKPINESFGLSSEIFITAFLIYELVLRFCFIFPWKEVDSIVLSAAIVALLMGRATGAFVLNQLKGTFTDHPLKHEAVKRYFEMLDLDVDSDMAVRATAKALGLPDDQVRTWIVQNKGRLRTK